MNTPPRLRNFFRYLAIGMCHFRYLWNGLCDRHRAEITVMQFTGHSLPVHHSEEGPLPCPILSAELTCAISLRLLAIGMCHFRNLPNGMCDCHRAEITIMQFTGHSLPVHHCFYGNSENFFFTLSHIVSQAVFLHFSSQ